MLHHLDAYIIIKVYRHFHLFCLYLINKLFFFWSTELKFEIILLIIEIFEI